MYRVLSFSSISKLLIRKRFPLVVELITCAEGVDSSSNFIPLLFFFFIGVEGEGFGVISAITVFSAADLGLVGIADTTFGVAKLTFLTF